MNEKLKVFGIEFLCLLAVIAIVAGVAWLLFGNKYPFDIETPEAKTYSKLDRTNYQVSASGIENEEKPKEIFSVTPSELENNQTDVRYVPGKPNPFSVQNGESILPTETVSISISNSTENGSISESNPTESGEEG